ERLDGRLVHHRFGGRRRGGLGAAAVAVRADVDVEVAGGAVVGVLVDAAATVAEVFVAADLLARGRRAVGRRDRRERGAGRVERPLQLAVLEGGRGERTSLAPVAEHEAGDVLDVGLG